MKILLGITKSNFGGAQKHVFDLAQSLAQEHEVSVLLGGDGLLAGKLRDIGCTVITLESLHRDVSLSNDVRTTKEIVQILKREKPDVFHVHSSKMGLLGTLAARISGVPRIIFTAHGWAFNEERGLLARLLIHILAGITVLLSHRTIAVSEAMKRQMHFPFAKGKMSVIHNGITPMEKLSRDEARAFLREKNSIPDLDGEIWISTIAELHRVKGLQYAIDAMQDVKEARYIVMGEGAEHQALDAQIKLAGLENRVHLSGFIEGAPKYLSAFDIALVPSLSEGLSYAVLESGAAGLPVIATNVGGIPEIISSDEYGVLVPARDTNALVKTLTSLISNPQERESLGKNLSRRVRENFSKETMLRDVRELYRQR